MWQMCFHLVFLPLISCLLYHGQGSTRCCTPLPVVVFTAPYLLKCTLMMCGTVDRCAEELGPMFGQNRGVLYGCAGAS